MDIEGLLGFLHPNLFVIVLGALGTLFLVAVLDKVVRAGGVGHDAVPDKVNFGLIFLKMLWEFRYKDFVKFVADHRKLFNEAKRSGDHAAVTAHFYDLMGSFIALYYGPCFHFVPPEKKGQSKSDAVLGGHQKLARMLQLTPGKTALDIGCGVGGLVHDIGSWSGASVTGLTLSSEEVSYGNNWLRKVGLDFQCKLVQGDAYSMPFPPNSFDAAYAVYAFKYFTSLDKVLAQVNNVLKPGGTFLIYDIIKTDIYDNSNPVHRKIVEDFEYSCGMPSIHTRQSMLDVCAREGLECVAMLNLSNEVPWYYEWDVPLLHFLLTHPIPRSITRTLESLGLLPKGFPEWLDIFVRGTIMNIYRGGKMGILSGSELLIFKKK